MIHHWAVRYEVSKKEVSKNSSWEKQILKDKASPISVCEDKKKKHLTLNNWMTLSDRS